jgi:hypothetical protein
MEKFTVAYKENPLVEEWVFVASEGFEPPKATPGEPRPPDRGSACNERPHSN